VTEETSGPTLTIAKVPDMDKAVHRANAPPYCFSKLKQFRAVAIRYDKREQICQGTVDVASIRIWLRDPVP
jgi:transposase